MTSTTMPKRAISVVLAAMLACTLMPSASLAYATERATDSSSAVEDTQSQATEAAQAEAPAEGEADGAEAEAADVAAEEATVEEAAGEQRPDVVNESHQLAQPPAADQAQSAADEAPAADAETGIAQPATDVEILSANVALNQQSGAVLSYNGLTYEVDPQNPAKVALVGLSNNTLEGALEIPARVSDGATTYTVSGVKKVRGGVHR